MEQRNDLQQTAAATRHFHEAVAPHQDHRGTTIISVLIWLAWLIMLIVGIVQAQSQVRTAAVVLVWVSIPILFIVGLASLVYPIWHHWYMDRLLREHARLDTQAKREQMEREKEEHHMKLHLQASRLYADERGNRPFVYEGGQLLQVTGGNFIQPVPNHYHHEVNYSDTSTRAGQEAAAAAVQAFKQPSQRYLIDLLEENMLQVCPGIRTSDGQPVILSIPDAVHFKLIGSSGFGKSCLAAALLDQAVRLNSPDVLQIALLDLEHKTSRLFENATNVATLQVGRRSVPMVATSADEVATHLALLRKELDRRALLSEYDLQGEPLLLIYVEEMLSLQFEVDEGLIEQMLKNLSVLAVRARKYNMFLLACAQTDYSTPELKTAQKQFRSRMAFAIDSTAARAAGFMSGELIKYNFTQPKDDHTFVLETPGIASLMLAPVFDVQAKVLAMDTRSRTVQGPFNTRSRTVQEPIVNADERPLALRSPRSAEVQNLLGMGWGKQQIIEKVWQCKKGGSSKWKDAEMEYQQIIEESEQSAQGGQS